jgi:hypothetical protein
MQQVNPKSAEVARLAKAAAIELDGWVHALEESERAGKRPTAIPVDQVFRLGHRLAGSALTSDRSAVRDYDWDFAGQHALALIAVYHAAGGSTAGSPVAGWKPAITALRQTLAFPGGAVAGFNSPKGYDPRKAAGWFRELHTLTDTGKGQR